eukprot:jgi/Chrzof1/13772/Cz08g11180.t1
MEGEDEGELQSGMATEQEAEVASEGVLQVEASSEDSAAKGEGDDEAEEEIAAGVVEGHDDEVDRQGEGQTGGGLLIHQASESDTEAEGEAEIQSEVEVGIDTVTGEKEVPEQGSATEGTSEDVHPVDESSIMTQTLVVLSSHGGGTAEKIASVAAGATQRQTGINPRIHVDLVARPADVADGATTPDATEVATGADEDYYKFSTVELALITAGFSALAVTGVSLSCGIAAGRLAEVATCTAVQCVSRSIKWLVWGGSKKEAVV